MTKYELSLTKDYVPGWTLVDAMREFFQNAVDQEVTQDDNEMFWNYSEERQVFTIGNKKSVLEPKTLLLGSSTKTDDDKTIGQFGEGYKVATLVLLRLGKTVKFYNYGAKEVWTPRFSKSRKYGAEILVFDVDKKFPWTTVPDNNLTIEIGNVTEKESFEIGETNLHMQEGYAYYETEFGKILLDEDLKGKVFVNGLFVCDYAPYQAGYDFKPQQLELDRDRKLVSDFDLKWLSSKMWSNPVNDEMRNLAAELVRQDAADTKFIASQYATHNPAYIEVADQVLQQFKKDHGNDAVPVTTTEELERLKGKHKAVIVSDEAHQVMRSSENYSAPSVEPEQTLKERLIERLDIWADTWADNLPETAMDALYGILEDEVTEDE